MSQNHSPAHPVKPVADRRSRARAEARPLPEPASVVSSNTASPRELADRWLQRRRERRETTYLRRTLLDHYNIAMLTAVAVSSMISGSLWVLLAGLLAEIAVIAVVPRIGAFRRRVDDHLSMLEHAELAKEREQLLLQMHDDHRDQFERLEYLVERVRHVSGDDVAAGALNRELGLDRMLATYVELAIAHRRGHQFLAMTSRRQLERELQALRARVAETASDRIGRLQQHRIAIAEKRLERWDQNREHLDVVGQQLATISELIQLVHEHSMTPMSSRAIAEEIDHLLGEIDENDGILRELAEACGDPRMVEATGTGALEAPADESAAGRPAVAEQASGGHDRPPEPAAGGWSAAQLGPRLTPVRSPAKAPPRAAADSRPSSPSSRAG